MVEGNEREVIAFALIFLLPIGIYVFVFGEDLYKTTSVQSKSYFPAHLISLQSNISNANLTEFVWEVATPYNESAESEWKFVRINIGSIQVNYTMNIQFPHEARYFHPDYGCDLVNESYVWQYDYHDLTIILRDHIASIYFEWKVFAQWTYDTYLIEMPLIPFFYNCVANSSQVEIVTPEGAFLDLSRTFPYPDSSIGEPRFPTYVWNFSKPHEIRQKTCLRVWFIFPEKSRSLRDTAFKSGLYVAFGVSMIIAGLTNFITWVVYARSKDSWTRSKLREIKEKLMRAFGVNRCHFENSSLVNRQK